MIYNEKYLGELNKNINMIRDLEKLQSKKILITGATGMIGSAIIDILMEVNNVINLNIKVYIASRNHENAKMRFNRYVDSKNIIFVNYDATKELDFGFEVNYIIHAASNAHPAAYSEYPVETMLANFIGVNNLLKYATENKNSRLLYVSSSEVYGNKEDNELYNEDDYGFVDILNPRACYPSSKRASETLCLSYKMQYSQDVVIARPGHVYGPTYTESDTRAFVQFANNSLNGKNIVMKSPGLQLRSYMYVLDCATAILTVLLKGESGEAYNISNSESIVTIRELAEMFAMLSNTKIEFHNPSDKEKSSYNLMSNSALNSKKLESLGWTGIYDLKIGVKNMLDILNIKKEHVL